MMMVRVCQALLPDRVISVYRQTLYMTWVYPITWGPVADDGSVEGRQFNNSDKRVLTVTGNRTNPIYSTYLSHRHS